MRSSDGPPLLKQFPMSETPPDAVPFLSVVFSFVNEEDTLAELVARTRTTLAGAEARGWIAGHELIFVNDASTDASEQILLDESRKQGDLKILTMSRPFGIAECLMAGFAHACGDLIAYLDADLQDPPELIATLLQVRRENPDADVVYTVRTGRLGENRWKMAVVRAGYRLFRRLSNVPIPMDAGDFKLVSRRVMDHVLGISDRWPFIRGMISFTGFKQIPVPYERQARVHGGTRCPLFGRKVVYNSMIRGLISYSDAPLLWAFIVSGLLMILALGAGLAALLEPAGRAQIPALLAGMFFTGALMAFLLGIQNLYVMDTRRQVRGHPLYIIARKHGFSGDNG